MMSDTEIIEVVSAHAAGKEIQYRLIAENLHVPVGWQDDWKHFNLGKLINGYPPPQGWDFQNNEYRVKPEPRKPREWYAEIPTDEVTVGQIFTNSRQLTKGGELVRVREVIEE